MMVSTARPGVVTLAVFVLLQMSGVEAHASPMALWCEVTGRVLKVPIYKGIVEEKIPISVWVQSVSLVRSYQAPRPLCPFRPGEVIDIEAEIGKGVDREQLQRFSMVSLYHHRVFGLRGETVIWRIDSVAAEPDKPYPPREVSMPPERPPQED
jgi:hypothetical protein